MSRAEKKYWKLFGHFGMLNPLFDMWTIRDICSDYIRELKDEIRQKDELILKLERKGY